MLDLPDVTLIGVDTLNRNRLIEAMNFSTKGISFGAIVMLTDIDDPANNCQKIPTIQSIDHYSEFCLKELNKHFQTSHCLTIHYDGFVIDPSRWNPDWLEYDYIGCPWFWKENRPDIKDQPNKVGNGGFSLRSKKLCDLLATDEFENVNKKPEDVFICVEQYENLLKHGIKFASMAVAKEFSCGEAGCSYQNTFGFHGRGYIQRMKKKWHTLNK